MRLFGRSFGGGRLLGRARSAELRGDLAQATSLFAQAGRLDEAARVMVLQGDGELDPAARMRHYVQAVATAPSGSDARDHATRKHAALVLAIAADQGPTPVLRQDLRDAGRELERLGDHEQAAEAYGRAGDLEGQARALARGGEIDKLDALLVAAQERDRDAIVRRQCHQEVSHLAASGRRREALALAHASTDEGVRGRGKDLERRRVSGEVVAVTLHGRAMRLVLGPEVVVGRVATISVASAAVSRHHVVVSRRGEDVVVRDLASRNGTLLRGLALDAAATMANGIELRLGKEVPLALQPATELAGAVAIEVAGARYVAPLGPARLGIGAWRLERGADGWNELATDDDPPAFLGTMRLASRVTLAKGDAIACERDGAPVLFVEA